MTSILIIEDNDTMRQGMAEILKNMHLHVEQAINGKDGVDKFKAGQFDLVVTDYRMDQMNGMQVLEAVKKKNPKTIVLMITAYGSIELAVEAIQKGAADFITKPFSMPEFELKIKKLLADVEQQKTVERLNEENAYLREEIEQHYNYGEMIGSSEKMQQVYRTINKVAKTDSTVLITGESGTGKELAARAIHKAGKRKDNPFVRVNCGALAEGVLESELFGHEKGAFTGAVKRKRGRFELADGGTIFLDEISELSPAAQVKLLRVLQEGEFERVGGEETLQTDARVIAASNKDLQKAVQDGKFRQDLYFRLHIIPLHMPLLRERGDDIRDMAIFFLERIQQKIGRTNLSLSEQALKALLEYHWPGNVRELENVIENAAVLADGDKLTPEDLPLHHFVSGTETLSGSFDLTETVARVEKMTIEKALKKSKNKSKAAELLGLTPSALHYKLEKYGLL